jgi:zinc transport system substrate-binding protein
VQRLAFIAVFFFVAVLTAAETRPRIVTSFFPIYCWTVNITGDLAEVENFLPARAEPHSYAATIGDARKLNRADLIVINGLGLESWLANLQRGSPGVTNKIVAVSAGLDRQLLFGEHHHEHGPGHNHADHAHAKEQPNEHIWLDPALAAHGVSNILAALQRIDPANASAYASNAQAYVTRLHLLDAHIRQTLAGVTNRAVVTYHDAFPYFARRYGLEIVGVVEQVPGVNPTAKNLAQLRSKMRSKNIPVIFVAPGGQTPVAQRIARDLNAKLAELDTLESGPLSPSAYEKQMLGNATVLQSHLK